MRWKPGGRPPVSGGRKKAAAETAKQEIRQMVVNFQNKIYSETAKQKIRQTVVNFIHSLNITQQTTQQTNHTMDSQSEESRTMARWQARMHKDIQYQGEWHKKMMEDDRRPVKTIFIDCELDLRVSNNIIKGYTCRRCTKKNMEAILWNQLMDAK